MILSSLQIQNTFNPRPNGRLGSRNLNRCMKRKLHRFVTISANSNPVSGEKFDYVIVGGGTAGCVLANRLSQDQDKKVLVLEAGQNNKSFTVKAPAGIAKLFKSPLDWNLYTIPQATATNRNIYVARGKLLGGSSSTNACLYHRGAAEDYDAWNLPDWTSKEVLEWYKASENNPQLAQSNPQYHGTGGSMNVELPNYQNKLLPLFFSACEEAGMKPNPDFNDWSKSQEGYGPFQMSTVKGRRADAYRQYLKPILKRENLTVLTGASTTKIEIDKSSSTQAQPAAKAVTFTQDGTSFTAELQTGGEVLLCSGAVHSPHLLMLSGIGPKAHLRDFQIDSVVDLPGVGQNLMDHPACLSAFEMTEEANKTFKTLTDHYNPDGITLQSIKAIFNFVFRGKGILTSTGCDRGAFVITEEAAKAGSKLADLQMRFPPGFALNPDGVGSYVDFARLKAEGKLKKWPPGITFQLIACRPKSRGKIELNSSDPLKSPAIDLAYLSDPKGQDLKTLISGIKLSRKLAAADSFKGVLSSEKWPSPDITSDEDLEAYIRRTIHSANAVVGSCKMGQNPKDGAVVLSDLKVHGVDNLRVVDSSVIPVIPGGQTAAPTVMIAERAASFIRNK
eukprot:TRINITY_DN367_c1_g1_i1.p1 TRINITY_DN367_c1_g1~~TRINITY_DN367_c1_g1_i1.p1  ORF type:complete len:618 (-),score=80.66 TRINITY_DN367_c1_g1_i1:475-2328(-)